MSDTISVEVAYALLNKQKIIAVQVSDGATAYEAAVQSNIVAQFDGLDIDKAPMGIFGKAIKPKQYVLKAGDRVEIYRPLKADPKEVRKRRAAEAKAKRDGA